MKKLTGGLVVIALAIGAWFWFGHKKSGSAGSSTATGSAAAMITTSRDRAKPAVPATVSGTVIDADKHTPIAGATIALVSNGMLGSEFSVAQPTVTAISDASGAWTATNVLPGAFVITATAASYLPGRVPGKVAVASGEQKTGIAITMKAGGTLVHGTVSDIGGGAIEGARVRFVDENRLDLSAGEYITLTQKDGTYGMTVPDAHWTVKVSHDDYVARSDQADVQGKPITLDFTLVPGGAIRGQVIARDTGKPVPFALVKASGHERFSEGGPQTACDADGKFTAKGLRSGVIAISAFGRGYASIAPTTVELGIGEQVQDVRVVVDHALSITGTTVQKGSKTAIPGVNVGVFSMTKGAQVVSPNPSDEQGRFAIDGVQPGSYMIFALGEGAIPNIGQPVTVVDKDVEVTVELERGVNVSGHVEPPQAAAINIEMTGPVGIGNMFEAVKTMMVNGTADAQTGEFALHNVPAGAFKLIARGTAGPTGTQPLIVSDHDQTGVVVKLEDRGAIAGRVIDTTGQPQPNFTISTHRTDDDKGPEMFTMNMGAAEHTSGADGTFKIVGLEAGTYDVSARQRDDWEPDFQGSGSTDKKKKVSVTVVVGQTKGDVVITVEARNGVITGIVTGGDKNPAADTWVTAKRDMKLPTSPNGGGDDNDFASEWGPTSEPVLTGQDGKFTIKNLKAGTYTVSAEGPRGGSRAEKKSVKPGDSVTLELAPLGTLAGKVTNAGAPVTLYTIDCHGQTGIERTIAAADGAYAIEHLAPGKYTCEIEADSGTAKDTVDVTTGSVTKDFALTGWASITGTVVSMFDKSPVPGIAAIASGNENVGDILSGGGPHTDQNGRFTLPKVKVGEGNLALMSDSSGFQPLATKQFTAIAGQKVDIGTIEIAPPRKGDAGTFGFAVAAAKDGLTVTSVKPGGPAANAGIAVGDTITAIDGRSVTTDDELSSLNYLSSGSIGIGVTVQLTINTKQVQVTSVKW
ncbi:MAG: carboxypeptidase regulatory-like domain-containing protein [Kofleriaceae bacterium]